jgi:hypothetical protein
MTTKPPLQKILQGILHSEDESKKKKKEKEKEKKTSGQEDRKYQTTGKEKTSNQEVALI